ncbi:LuxR C-terminal-related transcriptional regulator [Amycolatopsis antarctica]|uniref:LuxR C-terminal-related transcriptional regulator n=1 Tax=Amycolatopsis antarctica TaxID=1854586 RepID=UPI0013FD6278|nr:response regulator transcription factor [Amycolatopsis antarctica]
MPESASHNRAAVQAGPGGPIRLRLHHPDTGTRSRLRAALTAAPGIKVVGSGTRPGTPGADVVVLGLPVTGLRAGLDTIRTLRATREAPRIVALGQDHDQETVVAAVEAGAQAFLGPGTDPAELVRAVRVVADGGGVLCPCGVTALIDAHLGRRPAAGPQPATVDLSRREREVLHLLARGDSSAEIARNLTVTEATVRSHIHHLLGKLGLRSRAQAVAYAFRHGFEPGGPSAAEFADHRGHPGHRRRVEHGVQRHLHT